MAHFIPQMPDLNGMSVNIGREGVQVVDNDDGQVQLPNEEESFENNQYDSI